MSLSWPIRRPVRTAPRRVPKLMNAGRPHSSRSSVRTSVTWSRYPSIAARSVDSNGRLNRPCFVTATRRPFWSTIETRPLPVPNCACVAATIRPLTWSRISSRVDPVQSLPDGLRPGGVAVPVGVALVVRCRQRPHALAVEEDVEHAVLVEAEPKLVVVDEQRGTRARSRLVRVDNFASSLGGPPPRARRRWADHRLAATASRSR